MAFSSRTVGTVEWLTGWSSSSGRWRLLRIASMRAGCGTWLLYGLAVRLSSVPLDHPQPTCRQRCLERAKVPLANIKNVRLAADANSDCCGGMARRPVEDAVLSAQVAGGDHHASSRLGHDRKDSRHHLTRRYPRRRPDPTGTFTAPEAAGLSWWSSPLARRVVTASRLRPRSFRVYPGS